MASIYARGNVLWCRVRDGAKWVRMPTPYRVGDEAKARRFTERTQEALDARNRGVVIGPLTVALYAEQWLRARRELHAATAKRDTHNDCAMAWHSGRRCSWEGER